MSDNEQFAWVMAGFLLAMFGTGPVWFLAGWLWRHGGNPLPRWLYRNGPAVPLAGSDTEDREGQP